MFFVSNKLSIQMAYSPAGRYSEGELADSPEYSSRRKMTDEISVSLSEEDQNSDALDIKPPQHHAGSHSRSRKRDRDRTSRRGSEQQEQGHSHGRERKSKEYRHFSREERKESQSRRHNLDPREKVRDPRKEDLRERLERERRLRKANERMEKRERREGEHERRQHSEHKREKRIDRERRPSDLEDFENLNVHREERGRRREVEQYQTISSPESHSGNDFSKAQDEDEREDKEEDMGNQNVSSSSLESSDEGEASSTSSNSSDSEDGEASPEVKSKTNGKHKTPQSDRDYDDVRSDLKRFKSEEPRADETEAMETSQREIVTPTPSPVELREEFPPYLPAIMGCRSVEEFECLNKIEEGTYGVVYRARNKKTDEIVALKRLKMEREKEGFPITSLREVSTLLKAQHPNIVTVREIVVGSNMDKIFMVMDYVEHDLKSLMETLKAQKTFFLPGEVKCLLQQLLRAVAHLHDNWILHRDLKTSNLLLSHRGILKVGDFGLAREYGSPLKAYTSIVVTLWYRAPELLLGAKEYSTPIDVWSVGCIFGELLTMEAIFQGKFEADQINKIFRDLGTPNDTVWKGYSELPVVKKATFVNNPVSNLRKRFASRLSELGLDLLQKFLTYDPAKRITAEDALNHTYLKESPLPIDPSIFPTWPAKSEQHGPRKAQSPKPPSGGRAYKQLGDNDDDVVDTNSGFTMGNAHMDRRLGAVGAGFSLRF